MKTLSKFLIATAQGVEQAVIAYESMTAQERLTAQKTEQPRKVIGFASNTNQLSKTTVNPFTQPQA